MQLTKVAGEPGEEIQGAGASIILNELSKFNDAKNKVRRGAHFKRL